MNFQEMQSFSDEEMQSLVDEDLLQACRQNDLNTVQHLLGNFRFTQNMMNSALHQAACNNNDNPRIIQILIEYGCRIDETDEEGDTALHAAARHGHIRTIHLLLKVGCKFNQTNHQGETALHIALDRQLTVDKKTMYTLLKNGCTPDIKDNKSRTALHIAAEKYGISEDVIETLIKYSSNPDQKDNEGRTALHYAAGQGLGLNWHIIKTLLENGCKPDEKDKEGNTPFDLLLKKKAQVKDSRKLERDLSMKILKEYEICSQLGLPFEVKELDKKSADTFASLMKEEGYYHYEARIMLAGEQGTGKTTIARYLIGKGPTIIRVSTDGIELYNGLSFIDRETEEWMHGKQDFTLSDIAISRSLRQSEDTSIFLKDKDKTSEKDSWSEDKEENSADESSMYFMNADDPLHEQNKQMQNENSWNVKDVDNPFTDGRKAEPKYIPIDSFPSLSEQSTKEGLPNEIKELTPLEVHRKTTTDILQENITPSVNPLVHTKDKVELFQSDTKIKSPENSIITEVVNNPGIIGKLKKLFGIQRYVKEIQVSMTKERFWNETLKVGQKKLHQKKIAPVIIWDFGGQDVFYSTHQTFLTYRAIYLLVLDGSRNLDDPCPFEQYLPGKSGHKTARDYLKFWINTIVTYCKGNASGFPKILIVLTHKDKVKAVEVEQRRQQIFNDIENMFSGSPLLFHLVIKDRIFVNARNKRDPEMTTIKKAITEQVMEQPTWGQKLPKCFIPLELEFGSLLNRSIPVITIEHMKTINYDQPVRPLTDDELQVFLKFQHSVGRILYFDEANLNQHIILAPTHLIDAFKSIVTDRSFCKGDRLRQLSWDLMSQKGVIGKKSIEEIWKKNKYKKFQEHKEYLLGVMTHLDILVEPKRYDQLHKRISAEFYYIPSMVRSKDTTGYLDSPTFGHRNVAIAFSPSSSMIPPALSFRFVSYCLSIWAVKTYGQNNDEMLFHRSAVFTIDQSLDMCVNCDDEMIVVRLVHSRNRTLIMRDLASSIRECLSVALGKISQLYVKTSSIVAGTGKGSFNMGLCCSSPVDPCLLPLFKFERQDGSWICHKHGIEHTKDVLSSWITQKENIQCEDTCPVTDEEFLEQIPADIHLLRLSMQYTVNETKELANHLGMQYSTWERLYLTFSEEPERLNFETLRKCLDVYNITFNDIRKAAESGSIQNPHTICKVVREKLIDFDHEPEKWDMEPTEEHFDRLAPLVGNNSLAFLVELGMEFQTWEQIRFKQSERDLVKLNRDILQEWKTFCNINIIRPSLRHIGQAFNNIGKNIKIVEHLLADFF